MPQQFTSDSPTFDEINALRKPRVATVWVPLDSEILDRIAELEQELVAAERHDDNVNRKSEKRAPAIRSQLDELRTVSESAAAPVRMEALPRRLYRKLVELHPDPDGKLAWDEETFSPALLAATATAPELTSIPRSDFLKKIEAAEKADELVRFIGPALTICDDWSASQAKMLTTMAWQVNAGADSVPSGARSTARAAGSEPSSTSAAPEESPTPTS